MDTTSGKMKVLVFTSLYPNNIAPHQGVFIKERMVAFAKRTGCEVKVVAPVPYYPPIRAGHRRTLSDVVRHEIRDGLDVYHPRYLMTPKIGMFSYGFLMYISALKAVTSIQKTFDFDLIDAHFLYPDGFAAVLLGRRLAKPVVVSARGSDVNLYGRYARFPHIRPLLQYTLNKADRVIAVCQALKDAMIGFKIPADKITVVPNGVDPGKFFPYSQTEARRILGLPNGTFLLSVGGLVPRKGFHVLINALNILVREGRRTDLHLVIVGEGPYRRQLERQVSDLHLQSHVRFVGSWPHQDLHHWYSAADLFCLASDREGWPNVLLESLACGTPVVATAVWGIPDVICSQDYGLLTDRDERALARTIDMALEKSWDRDAILTYARSQTWDNVADSVSQVLAAAFKSAAHRVLAS
jgi:glycosyltransferase involved in cell wall biosynthesis